MAVEIALTDQVAFGNGTAAAQKPRSKEEYVEFNSNKWKGEQTTCRAVTHTSIDIG